MKEHDYNKDILDIRSMMERSTKFLSLSGWAGILSGIYALAGAYVAVRALGFNPTQLITTKKVWEYQLQMQCLIVTAFVVLLSSIGTAAWLSNRKAIQRKEKLWNPTSRRLLTSMAVPLVAGGLFILILMFKGLVGLIAPMSLLFYGLSLYIASRFTFDDIKFLGFLQIVLGLAGCYFLSYGMILWALGFGVGHIVYGIYVHYKYEK
jgi:uncharacterized membrane protein YidH (DUF202 family)